jgi:HAD superfamily hydrolase (TIGR01450 family)
VLKNYNGLIEGIGNTFKFLKEEGIDFYVLTNDASRGPKKLAEAYNNYGLHEITPDKIISSGMLAREYLKLKVTDGTVAFLGKETSAEYLKELGLKTLSVTDLDLDDVDDISVLVFMDDEGFDWNHDINKIVNLLRKRNIPSVVANTDWFYPVSRNDIAIAIGGIANMVEAITNRKFLRFGKPDSNMFIFAYDHSAKGRNIDKRKILMVGDTLYTDIIGANKFGIDTALVLTGTTLPHKAKKTINSTGIIPDYICHSAAIEF